MPNTPPRILYRNARLLDPATGLDRARALLTAGAEIVDFGPGLPAADAAIIDLDGLCLAPGLVDMRVSIGTDQQAETVGSVSRAAAAGGITALACLPDTAPPLDSPDALALLDRRARAAGLVRIYPYAALTRGM